MEWLNVFSDCSKIWASDKKTDVIQSHIHLQQQITKEAASTIDAGHSNNKYN